MPTKLNQSQQATNLCEASSITGDSIAQLAVIERDPNYCHLLELKKRDALRAVSDLRAEVLDDFERHFGKNPHVWPVIRARILTILGAQGFEQTIQRIFERPYIQKMPKERE